MALRVAGFDVDVTVRRQPHRAAGSVGNRILRAYAGAVGNVSVAGTKAHAGGAPGGGGRPASGGTAVRHDDSGAAAVVAGAPSPHPTSATVSSPAVTSAAPRFIAPPIAVPAPRSLSARRVTPAPASTSTGFKPLFKRLLRPEPRSSASAPAQQTAADPPIARDAAPASAGQRLDAGTLNEMERFFGADLGDVRVHADTAAAERARQLGAEAFTIGPHVYFGEGKFNPATQKGKGLLAHELTHVLQQKGMPRLGAKAFTTGGGGDRWEAEAEWVRRELLARTADGRDGLVVGRYRCQFESNRESSLSERARLEWISKEALKRCEEILKAEHGELMAASNAIREIDVRIDLTLATTTDEAAAGAWARQMAAAIVAARAAAAAPGGGEAPKGPQSKDDAAGPPPPATLTPGVMTDDEAKAEAEKIYKEITSFVTDNEQLYSILNRAPENVRKIVAQYDEHFTKKITGKGLIDDLEKELIVNRARHINKTMVLLIAKGVTAGVTGSSLAKRQVGPAEIVASPPGTVFVGTKSQYKVRPKQAGAESGAVPYTSIRWFCYYDPNVRRLYPDKKSPQGPRDSALWEITWEVPGNHLLAVHYELGTAQIVEYNQTVVVAQQELDAAFAEANLPAKPEDQLKFYENYLKTLQEVAAKKNQPLDPKVKADIEARIQKLKERLAETVGGTNVPFKAVYLSLDQAKSVALNVYVGKAAKPTPATIEGPGDRDIPVGTLPTLTIVDVTNPADRRLTGTYVGSGKTDREAIEAALRTWQQGNRYPKGLIKYEFPDSLGIGKLAGQFETTGSSAWDSLQEFFDKVGLVAGLGALALGALAVISPEPFSKAAAAAMWVALVSSIAARSISIAQRHAEGFVSSKEDAKDILSIATDICTARWLAGAKVLMGSQAGVKFARGLVIGQAVGTGAQGVILAEELIGEFESIQKDPDPARQMDRMLQFLQHAAVTGSMMFLAFRGAKGDLAQIGVAEGQLKQAVKRLVVPGEQIDLGAFVRSGGEEPGAPMRGPATTLTKDGMQELFTRMFKRPAPAESSYRVYPNEAEFANAWRSTPGVNANDPVPLGFFDPVLEVVHLPPRADIITTIHETLHAAGHQSGARSIMGNFWEEGMTEWLSRRACGPAASRHPYDQNVAFVRLLAEELGTGTLEAAYLHRQWGPLRRTLEQKLGGAANAEEFYRLVRSVGPNGENGENLAKAMDMVFPGSAAPGAKPSPVATGAEPRSTAPALTPAGGGGGRSTRALFTRDEMAQFLQKVWDSEPLVRRVAHARSLRGPAQHSELVSVLNEFQARTGITIQVVPEFTVQKARGAGNLASLRSRPGFLQIEEQVFQNTATLMNEVEHELAFHFAGGAGGTPILRDSMFNGLNLLEMMMQSGGKLPPPVAPIPK
jgi:hypothetical protein